MHTRDVSAPCVCALVCAAEPLPLLVDHCRTRLAFFLASDKCAISVFTAMSIGCNLPLLILRLRSPVWFAEPFRHCPCTCITAFFGRPLSLPWRSTQSGCSHWCSSHISFVVCLVSGYLALDQCLASGIVAVAVQTKYHVQGLKKRKERYTVQVRTVLVVG